MGANGQIHSFDHPTALDLLTAIDNLPSDDEGKQLLVRIVGAQLLDPAVYGNVATLFEVNPSVHSNLKKEKVTTVQTFTWWKEWASRIELQHSREFNFDPNDPKVAVQDILEHIRDIINRDALEPTEFLYFTANYATSEPSSITPGVISLLVYDHDTKSYLRIHQGRTGDGKGLMDFAHSACSDELERSPHATLDACAVEGAAIYMVGEGFTLSCFGRADYNIGPATKFLVIIPSEQTQKFHKFLQSRKERSKQYHYVPSIDELRPFKPIYEMLPPGSYFIHVK
ncbi:hypothetical protein CYMTET_36823 [Cymbomonas tetramitiformis]|uniref:Uncharacterized protein n=1 Tax=Cymbomonas tetramitiformis TaxID=36881 RepID=A0AAE0CHK5_9CHLO|nr:hypothetical protein CYMTET_36823 [Cymbomonas tetramitiformis]